MLDTPGDLKQHLTPLFKWLNHVLNLLLFKQGFLHSDTDRHFKHSLGALIWELDPTLGQHHKNYLSKQDLQVPYREKGMSWILEVEICQGYTCWEHQKGCDVLFLSSSEWNSGFGSLWRLFSMTLIATPSCGTSNKAENKKLENTEQHPEAWIMQRNNFHTANIGFPLCSHQELFSNEVGSSCSPPVRNHLGSQTHSAAQKPHPGCQKPWNPSEWAWLVPSKAPVTAVTHSQP